MNLSTNQYDYKTGRWKSGYFAAPKSPLWFKIVFSVLWFGFVFGIGYGAFALMRMFR
jgi:hypothetical protein